MEARLKVVREEDLTGFGGDGHYFRCHLCGHRFQVGDKWRYHYGESIFTVCEACDDEDSKLEEKWIELHKEAAKRFWWLFTPKSLRVLEEKFRE